MKTALILAAALLTGCGTTKTFTNRVATTAACDQVLVVSMYGPFGIATKADEADAAAIMRGQCASTEGRR